MLTHLPLGDSGTRLQRPSLPRTSMFRRISLLVSWAGVGQRRSRTPLLNKRRTRTTPTTADVRCISLRFQSANTPAMSKNQRQPATTVQAIQYKPSRTGAPNMAIRLITGCLQQRSRYCAKQQQFFYRKLHAVYINIDGCHYV